MANRLTAVILKGDDFQESVGKLNNTAPAVVDNRVKSEIKHDEFGKFYVTLLAAVKYPPSQYKDPVSGEANGAPTCTFEKIPEKILNDIRQNAQLSDDYKEHLVTMFEEANTSYDGFVEMMNQYTTDDVSWGMEHSDTLFNDEDEYTPGDEASDKFWTKSRRSREFLRYPKVSKEKNAPLDRTKDPTVPLKFKYYQNFEDNKAVGSEKFIQGIRGFYVYRLEGEEYDDFDNLELDQPEDVEESDDEEAKEGEESEESEEGSEEGDDDDEQAPFQEVVQRYKATVEPTVDGVKTFLRYNDVVAVTFELQKTFGPDNAFISTSGVIRLVKKFETFKLLSNRLDVDEELDPFVRINRKRGVRQQTQHFQDEDAVEEVS
jgi:hypothetical protein